MKLRIGSRGSKLALAQTNQIAQAIQTANPGLEVEVLVIKTKGDRVQDRPLNAFGDKGVFVKEIEDQLCGGGIDLAVHSLKDMPSELPQELCMSVTPKREDPRDVLVTFSPAACLADLPEGCSVATGSPRRMAQLLQLRPDIQIMPIRGNVETRMKISRERGCYGVLLAAAGLRRLQIPYQGFPLSLAEMIPAPAQGILGLEYRKEDQQTSRLLQPLHDEDTGRQAQAERAFLRFIDGGCHAPTGAYCELNGDSFTITGFYQNGTRHCRKSIQGVRGEEWEKGRELALQLKECTR